MAGGRRLLILVEGLDGAGKSSLVARLARTCLPWRAPASGVPREAALHNLRVVRLDPPTPCERWLAHLPGPGEVVLADRSYYSRGVIEPLMGWCSRDDREAFLSHAPVFERALMAEGITLVKLWLDVSAEEQRRRLTARPRRTPADEAALTRRDEATALADEMRARTAHPGAPWFVVDANNWRSAMEGTLNALRESFRIFNEQGGKFRVAVANVCNLNCFFCHNEAMPNPRTPGTRGRSLMQQVGRSFLDEREIVGLINAYARLGGRQINITGGEPLAHPRLHELFAAIEKRQTKIVLNTNAVLAHRLLRVPKLETLDEIFASLHTTENKVFQEALGGRSVEQVMTNIVALSRHGYLVQLNYSLNRANLDGFDRVLDFALEHRLTLKAIALVRSHGADDFYGPGGDGDWIDPAWLRARLAARGAEELETKNAFGGRTTTYRVGQTTVKVKNVAEGRLVTDFCAGCPVANKCGEGVYGLRVGVDGMWKPCLLGRHQDRPVQRPEVEPFEQQILGHISSMLGDFRHARFTTGAPA